eukprot:gene11242-4062_t
MKKQTTSKVTFVECSLFSYVQHPRELETFLYGLFGTQPTRFSEYVSIYIKTIVIPGNQGNSVIQKRTEDLKLYIKKNKENWTVSFYGVGQIKNRKVCVRTITNSIVKSDNAINFLKMLDCKFDYDYFQEGVQFEKNNIIIQISSIKKNDEKKTKLSEGYFIEMKTTSTNEKIDVDEKEMMIIADQLSSIITFTKDLPRDI